MQRMCKYSVVYGIEVGRRGPAEMPPIKERLMFATPLCNTDVWQMEMFDLSAGRGDRVIVSPGASTPPHLRPRPFGDKFCQ